MSPSMSSVITKRILFVDPDPHIQQIVQTCMQTLGGWQVIAARSGRDGLIKAESEQPDAIVLEGVITDMDIVFFLQRLQADPKSRQIPVILLTLEPSFTERQRLLQLGVVGAIAKPFDPLTLVPKIKAALDWD